MFKSVDHHNPTLELTMVKRKMWGLLSYSLRKHNSHSIQSNPRDSNISCDWLDVADSQYISNCRDHYWNHHNFTTCRPLSQPFFPGLWRAVCYLNSKFASFDQSWQLFANESRKKIMSDTISSASQLCKRRLINISVHQLYSPCLCPDILHLLQHIQVYGPTHGRSLVCQLQRLFILLRIYFFKD